MSRKEREGRATSLAARTSRGDTAPTANPTAAARYPGAGPNPHQKVPVGAAAILDILAERDDGWMRFIPSRDGGPIYIKWKFVRGPHERKYVMATAQSWQVDYCLSMLMMKLTETDAGNQQYLAKDTWYNHTADEMIDG